MMTELETIYRRSDNFVFRRIEGETILVPIKGNVEDLESIYSLNETAALAWQNLDGARDLKTVAGLITEEYDVPREQAESDLLAFVQEMKTIAAVFDGGR